MRYSLKKLLAITTGCSLILAINNSAGFWVTVCVLISLCLLVWSIATPKRRFWIILRAICGTLGLVALWFLAIDSSWFVWECPECLSRYNEYEYRILGITVSREETYELQSTYGMVLQDLGVPCRHDGAGTWHKHRWWGLVYCRCPFWDGIIGLIDERYSGSISASIQELGRTNKKLAEKTYRQIIIRDNFSYLWDAIMADQFVQDAVENKTAFEALEWLQRSTSTQRILGDHNEKDAQYLIEDLYAFGAKEILVFDLEEQKGKKLWDGSYDIGGCATEIDGLIDRELEHITVLEAHSLAIKLPPPGADRKNIFSLIACYLSAEDDRPKVDYGQSYLHLYLY